MIIKILIALALILAFGAMYGLLCLFAIAITSHKKESDDTEQIL